MRVSDVAGALSELRHRSRDGTSARTAVMTFIAVAGDDGKADAASSALRTLGSNHPARIVILRPEPDAVAALDARATLFSVEGAGHEVNFEEIALQVCGQAAKHLDSLVDAFVLSDLPVAVWYVGAIPEIGDPLLDVATAVLVDSRDAADSGRLRGLLDLARRRTVVDLSWMRLKPWRSLFATLFSEPRTREWLSGVESVAVEGKAGPRHMLGGWMMAQLGMQARQVRMQDARHVRIDLECRIGDEKAAFQIGRPGDGRIIEARAVLPSTACIPHHVHLAEDGLAGSLSRALMHLEPDPVWERALSAATHLDG
ncbi:MAG TPA: glucose-6-phosphate dehydrogenase assembly protein OpcA [Acidimicrobiales bacterium]|nr:glucose-6-phosphate dehydrogenase assembly protein OpcA [Acidimicrobiales bacterium]